MPESGLASGAARRRPGPWSGRSFLPLLALLSALAAGLLLPRPAAAHTRLESSVPARGDTLHQPPREVRLRFSRPAEARYTAIELLGPGGAAPVGTAVEREGSGSREFIVPLPSPLAPGTYTVRWRTAGRDGHVLRGSFTFTVAPPPSLAGSPDTTDKPAASPAAGERGRTGLTPSAGEDGIAPTEATAELTDPAAPLPVSARWLVYLGLLGMTGAASFQLLVLRRLAPGLVDDAVAGSAARGALRAAAGAVALSALSLPVRLWMQSASLAGTEHAFAASRLMELLGGTLWGAGWLLQAVATGVFALALLAARRDPLRSAGWKAAAAAAVAGAVSPALSGHAAAVEGVPALAVLSDALHVLGAGVWLGTLAVLVAAGLPVALAGDGPAVSALASMVRRFSPVALVSASLVAATGAANALFHLGAIPELWTTGYGRALLVKLALVAIAAAAGFHNWRTAGPALGTPGSAGRFRGSATVELAAGAAVLLATAVLAALPTP